MLQRPRRVLAYVCRLLMDTSPVGKSCQREGSRQQAGGAREPARTATAHVKDGVSALKEVVAAYRPQGPRGTVVRLPRSIFIACGEVGSRNAQLQCGSEFLRVGQ